MATGRYGDYSDIKVRRRESETTSGKELSYAKEEYDRLKNGQPRMRDARGRVKVRQTDIKERGAVESGDGSFSRISGSENVGRKKREGSLSKTLDREPGELSSESGSDEVTDSGAPAKAKEVSEPNEAPKLENSAQSTAVKKRNFSPIVWAGDDKEICKNSSIRVTSLTALLPPPPPLPKNLRQTPEFSLHNKIEVRPPNSGDNNVQLLESLPVKLLEGAGKVNGRSAHSMIISSSPSLEKQKWSVNPEAGHLDDDDLVPTRNISSSRWADVVGSPRDLGEISDDEGPQKRRKRMPRSESYEFNKIASTPDPNKGSSENNKGMLSVSEENVRISRSPSTGNFVGNESEKNELMDTDAENDSRGSIAGDPDRAANEPSRTEY